MGFLSRFFIKEDSCAFLAGLAGYTDAEGRIRLCSDSNLLRFEIETKNRELLQKIAERLQELGVSAYYYDLVDGFGRIVVYQQEDIRRFMKLLHEHGLSLKWEQYWRKLREQAENRLFKPFCPISKRTYI